MQLPATTAAVLYDLDGTLVDHDHAARAGVDAWCRELGMSGGQWERWSDIEQRWFSRFENGRISHLGQRIGRCREFLGRPELGEAEALELYEFYLAVYRENWRAFPDAAPSLDNALAAGLKVGILTNGAQVMQQAKMESTGLWREGMVMCATVEIGAPKPQPEAYLGTLERLGVTAEEAVMIGDSWLNDVAGARQVGMTAIHLDRGGDSAGSIGSLDEIVWG
ncbi:HAD family hydrolase [Corynebacterium sp. YIM 101645]|uniref:HAD family hydrolase n=1 Tax=Corynebacterium lemuris TaxID=1859292 RepID=A0ABT2FZ24_9CORY|nr:HAD family hydrolase [Corynebacterium lemuris]MCS5480492.1 HAD family hydrolase [Corynebacterium lemuris]